MFEKEAEEYAGNREVCDLLDAISEDLQNYDYGTIAHYNIDPLVEECFKDGAEFGYNKANEWHYVKDELPISDKDKYYFVVDKWNEPMIARFYEGVWSNYSTIEDVIAWKEIVLPELHRSNQADSGESRNGRE